MGALYQGENALVLPLAPFKNEVHSPAFPNKRSQQAELKYSIFF